MDLFDNISPLDYRYIGNKKSLVEKVSPYLSENARINYQALVELALVKALAKHKICPKSAVGEVEKAIKKVKAKDVYKEEEIIKHDVRGLVNCIRKNVSNKTKPYIHFGATSYDIVDTSSAIRYKDTTEKLLLPSLKNLEKTLIKIALKEKDTIQIGRTHGQHAEPITFGFTISEYVSRLGNRIKNLETAKNDLRGKFSGAVGTYNATSLFIKDPIKLEKDIMNELGLKPSVSSTQIVEPESLLDLIHANISCFSILANFCDDMRHLQRSEIAEIAEKFESKQVGSSTMPHKRNPINFENIKSMWKVFMPKSITGYLDQISEHQRDLTNSASQRFIPELIAALYISSEKLNKVLENLVVDRENLKKNFDSAKEKLVAEPLYILLAFYGHPDAHEYVRKITLESDATGVPVGEIAIRDENLAKYIKKFTPIQLKIIQRPELYIGLSSKKTDYICKYWKKELRL